MTAAGWHDLLDALEEQTRRWAAQVEGVRPSAHPAAPTAAVELLAAGPLPVELRLRAAALVAETSRLAELVRQRQSQTSVALRYSAPEHSPESVGIRA